MLHSRADRLTTPTCRSVAAATVDAAVAERLLAALDPRPGRARAGRRRRGHRPAPAVSRAAELAVERARYDADRAERAFWPVEPENRLVARTLEARWEARLAALAEAEQALAAQPQAAAAAARPRRAGEPAADLPALWPPPTTSDKDRKRLLRTLIADVTITPSQPTPPSGGRAPLEHRRHRRARGHPTPQRHPAAYHRPGRDRTRQPDRPRPGQRRPGRRAQPAPGTAPAPGSPSTVSPPATCATTTTSPTPACSPTAS